MTEQSASEASADLADPAVRDPGTQAGPWHAHEARHGRPGSWVTSAVVIAGFIVGGIALTTGPTWWLFWTGAGIVVLGAIIGAAVHIFDDWY